MQIIKSITNGNWSSISTWDKNIIPDENDVVYINHHIYLDVKNSDILDLYITNGSILECDSSKTLTSNNIVLIGYAQIIFDDKSDIKCNTLKSEIFEEEIIIEEEI